MADLSSQEIARLVEWGEARAWANYYSCAPRESAQAFGVCEQRVGQAWVTMLAKLDDPFFNRISCLGVDAPATESDLDGAIRFLEAAGCRNYLARVSPAAQPAELPGWLAARGFKPERNAAKMFRHAEPPPLIHTDLRIEKIGTGYADSFSAIAITAFDMPAELFAFMSCHIGKPGWLHYLAFDGELPVSAACTFLSGDVAWLGFGCTLPSHRGRGGQGALFARRIADGLAASCKWFVTETGEDTPASPNPSYHNMRRAGFRLAYLRPNFVHEATPPAR